MNKRVLSGLVMIVVVMALGVPSGDVRGQDGEPHSTQPTPSTQQVAMRRAQAMVAQGQFEDAIEAYREITREWPDLPQGWFMLGYCLHADGQLDEAIEMHEKAAAYEPTKVLALYNLGCAHALQGDADEAFAALNKSFDAGFNNTQQLMSDTDLVSIREDERWADLTARLKRPAPGSGVQPGVVTRTARNSEFDFWIGRWDVYNPEGKKVGSNRIEVAERGRVIMEFWTSASGNTGRSMNFYNPGTKQWHQNWVADNGGVTLYTGSWKDGAMRFMGTAYGAGGGSELSEMTFTPNDDGTVRQYIRHSKDGGKTWTVYFDGMYKRAKSEDGTTTQATR